jgi:hypothetical protein
MGGDHGAHADQAQEPIRADSVQRQVAPMAPTRLGLTQKCGPMPPREQQEVHGDVDPSAVPMYPTQSLTL